MKYYYDPRSGSCRRTSAVIGHLGLEVEFIHVDLIKQENRLPAILSLNPNGMLPILKDGDTLISEASAINIHLCEKAGDTSLLADGSDRAEVFRWMFWAAEHFRQPAPIYFEEKLLTGMMGTAPDQTRLDEADRRLDRFGPVLDAHLERRSYVVGDAVTLADFDLAAPLSQMARTGVPYHRFPNIMAWYERLAAEVPAWRKSGEDLDAGMTALMNAA